MPNFACCETEHVHKGPMYEKFAELDSISPHNPNLFREFEFVNHQGLMLHAYGRQPTGPKRGACVLQHGTEVHSIFGFLLAEQPGGPHVMLEGTLPGRLLDEGYAVYLLDMQGHGLSDAVRGQQWFMESFDDLAKDFLLFVDLVRKIEVDTQNIFAFGVSMGGGIVTNAAVMKPDFAKGMVLFCPMLSLEKLAAKPMNRLLRPLVSVLSATCPTARLAAMAKNAKFPFLEQEKERDQLCSHRTANCARNAAEALKFTEFMTKQGGFKKVKTPFIVLHSPDDDFVDPVGSERLAAEAAATDKKFVPATGMWHSLTVEPGRERLFDEVAAWLGQRS